MLHKLMKKLVYIRYEKKYRKWMERLEISVSDEELKKGIEEDGADGYEAEAPDEDCIGWVNSVNWLFDFVAVRLWRFASLFFIFLKW